MIVCLAVARLRAPAHLVRGLTPMAGSLMS